MEPTAYNVPAQPGKQANEIANIKKPAGWQLFFRMITSPAQVVQQYLSHLSWALAYSISGLAMGSLFLQTGLDMVRNGKIENPKLIELSFIGIALGTIGVMLMACLVWSVAKIAGSTYSLTDALRAFGFAYSPALLYSIFGLIINLFMHWNTTVAFGVTGLLWALNPMSAVIKQITNEKTIPALLLTTICGVLMLVGWAYLGGVL